ncbi:MAG: thioesterase family protein [Defluviitaleaceae bacterium]|nr:thioesterase family protein [Defluviitaleaceae bacterium]
MIGKTATATTTVKDTNTAKAVGSGNLDVFSTPMMIALMEEAACNVLANSLEPGQSSVGTQISIDHTAASPLNSNITATATITGIEGRKVTFDISAKDDKSEIGKGTHTRFIVDAERFMAKLK